MDTVATIVCIVLALAFLGAGIPKVLRVAKFREEVRRWRLPDAALPVIGLVEVLGAVLLLIGVITDSTGPAIAGALLLLVVAVGAVATHVRIKDPVPMTAPAAVLGVLAAVAVALLA